MQWARDSCITRMRAVRADSTDRRNTLISEVFNEANRDDSPFGSGPLRGIEHVEWVSLAWVDWYNQRRLHSTIGGIPPEEFEARYYAGLNTPFQLEMAPA